MQKEQFIKLVAARLEKVTGCQINIKPVIKNNGVVLTSLVILRDNQNTHPTIYIEPFYEKYINGEDFESIIKQMLEFEENSRLNYDFDFSYIMDFEKAKESICYRIVNYEANVEMLKDTPHRKYLDLVMVYHILVKDATFGEGSILISNDNLKMWGITSDEIYRIAKINTETKMQPIVKNIKEIVIKNFMYLFEQAVADGEIPADLKISNINKYMGDYPMYVVTNEQNYYGASVLMYTGFLKVVSEVMRDDLIIFPSSVHEFIFMKAEIALQSDGYTLKEMVENVNSEVVEPDEYLSDNVYFYDRYQNKLMIYDNFKG